MRRIFLDSNVLLAFHFQDAEARQQKAIDQIFSWIENDRYIGQISLISFYQLLHFIDRSIKSPSEAAKRAYRYLNFVKIVPFIPDRLDGFKFYRWSDYEDGLQYLCAESGQSDLIITTNGYDYHESKLPVIDPLNFVLREMSK